LPSGSSRTKNEGQGKIEPRKAPFTNQLGRSRKLEEGVSAAEVDTSSRVTYRARDDHPGGRNVRTVTGKRIDINTTTDRRGKKGQKLAYEEKKRKRQSVGHLGCYAVPPDVW